MLRVCDIMTRDVVSVAADSSLDAAASRFLAEDVSGAPVRDRHGNVVGVLSRSDLLDPTHSRTAAARVEDAMTPAVWAVHPEAPAIEAVELMVAKDIHRVLVVRGPGRLEGIITSMDVMRALAGGGYFHPEQPFLYKQRPGDGDEDDGEDEEGEERESKVATGVAS